MYYWDRTGILSPSVSPERTKLWSYADLMGLRVIYWLRSSKDRPDGSTIPPTSMAAVRKAIVALRALDLDIWTDGHPRVQVDRAGRVAVVTRDSAPMIDLQMLLSSDVVELTGPFPTKSGTYGPDLLEPRPRLRIIPGKLGGAPHVVSTRIETESLAALSERGFEESNIVSMYPSLGEDDVVESLDLERQLRRNLRRQPVAA
jgi:uncharacterized protein (DUF433 family)